ncbi:ComF family protein [Carboxylicivirga linearis]|uniref:ComF family protein n=1 Tax=Carboxylicivirga linearis TaxID=1628157 RepID=A0ABS5JP50_9BACT|nr:ComF family protein [Carboxylicivirga linearis]MBS2096685.1 ComF family protein [Carboxylicivirga linearis]
MNFTAGIRRASEGIFDLLYPQICSTCGTHLFKDEVEICKLCLKRLPRTNFEKRPTDNVVSALLWGRCKVESSYSVYYYRKGERVQQLLHSLKYKSNQALGVVLGSELGKAIKSSEESFDVMVPVPLHPLKQQKRGFNQSEVIANGIQKALDIPINTNTLQRSVHTSTQTKKGRFDRWKNVESIFHLANKESLKGKHILVVDDVITTGSTMEACINTLAEIENVKISLATIACAYL